MPGVAKVYTFNNSHSYSRRLLTYLRLIYFIRIYPQCTLYPWASKTDQPIWSGRLASYSYINEQTDLLYIFRFTNFRRNILLRKNSVETLNRDMTTGWLNDRLFINITLIILQYLSASLPGAMRIGVGISVSADQIN